MEQIETDGSANLNVRRGTRIHLRLPVTPGSGHLWTLSECGSGLMVERDRHPDIPEAEQHKNTAGSAHVAALRAISAGFWQVELQLSRAWERQTAEVRRFTITVT
ncbi:protease inhibitor I42 family protein [Glutamicibacter sp. MNS18]|uniref:protease inhibitor I42 family protein n=1 Tax=Glutamicibacter sp. MNS18 TaxID=2989817 RepID=UPI002236A9D6|nr:protease inhibitor I42 family protein [Glutamicibacter sp. MNS18]MCW4464577.1 protease inhibitor I42 family protein [Glutamicibacter sp. MNS18]